MLSFKFQSPSLKIEDFQINPINTFDPISNKRAGPNIYWKILVSDMTKIWDFKISHDQDFKMLCFGRN